MHRMNGFPGGVLPICKKNGFAHQQQVALRIDAVKENIVIVFYVMDWMGC